MNRSKIGWLAAVTIACLMTGHPSPLAAQSLRVTLLGTGVPTPAMDRFGPSILVEAGKTKLLFDAGRAAAQRLAQLKVSYADLSALFLTHLHSDHVVGIPDLWLTGWLLSRRDSALRVFGPAGTSDLTRHLEEAFKFDIGVRISEGHAPVKGAQLAATDLSGEGVVFEQGGARVTAFLVDHGPTRPAYGYRVDYMGRSVVLSGDTRASPNLVAHARGADLLIHEVAGANTEDLRLHEGTRIIMSHHTTAEQAGEIFEQVHPRLAIYSHLALLNGFPVDSLVPLTRKHYAGRLVVGEDLMRFEVGDSVIVGAVAP